MGLLNSIADIAKKVVTAVVPTKAKIENVGAVLNAAFNPFSKDTVVANVSNPVLKTTLETVANHPYVSTALVAGGVTAVSNPTAALNVAKALVPTTTKGKIIAAVAAPVAAGVVLSAPSQSAKAIISTPSALVNVGQNIGTFAVNPSVENLKNIYKENPAVATVATSAGLIAIGSAVVPAVSNAISNQLTRSEISKQTDVFKEQLEVSKQSLNLPATVVPKNTTSSDIPVTPATQTVTAKPLIATTGGRVSTTRKRYKKKEPTRISQRVNVIVSNRSSSIGMKGYLNRRIYN
jgi:hypothetical protein